MSDSIASELLQKPANNIGLKFYIQNQTNVRW